MRILLLNPKPLGAGVKREECCSGPDTEAVLPSQILLCTEYLRQRDWRVDFIDQQVDDTEIQYGDYDVVVGWAATGVGLDHDMEPLKEASDGGAKTILILQAAPLLDMEAMARFPYVDVAIKEPEREITLGRLFAAWNGGSSTDLPPGLVYRVGNRLIDTGMAPFAKSWGHLSSAAGILDNEVDLSKYSQGLILASKGCPYRCTYCKFAHTPMRYRRPEDIVSEMIVMGRVGIVLLSQEFLVSVEWARQLCDRIAGSGARWSVLTRADHITNETAGMLKRAGCNCVIIGAETADEDILTRIGKDCAVETVIAAARICHSVELDCHFTFMVGFPWDTQKIFNKNRALIRALYPATYSVQTLFPYRGTRIYEEMREMGMFSREVPLETYCRDASTKAMFPGLHLTRDDITAARRNLQSEGRANTR